MHKIPSMSSKELVKLLEKRETIFVRQGSTDHAIY
jgi:predicted RNA binding protein YcfA (HicA-like mRNA interferase family)